MLIITTYDITDNKRLAKVAKIMEDYGTRVQYSVFEVYADAEILREIMKQVSRVINAEEDSVRFYPLCKNCQGKMEVLGNPVYISPRQEVVVY